MRLTWKRKGGTMKAEAMPIPLEEEPAEIVVEDFPPLKNIPTVMSFRSSDSVEDLDREPSRYSFTDDSLDKYMGTSSRIGINSSDSNVGPVWTHGYSSMDDDRDWYPEANSFDHYDERIAATTNSAAKEKKQLQVKPLIDNKDGIVLPQDGIVRQDGIVLRQDGIVLPPRLRSTWSEADTLPSSHSAESSTKENDAKQKGKSRSTPPGLPFKNQEEKSQSTPPSSPLKSALKSSKRSRVTTEATTPSSSPTTQPSTEITLAKSKDPPKPASPKKHSSTMLLLAESAAALAAGAAAAASFFSTSTESKAQEMVSPTKSSQSKERESATHPSQPKKMEPSTNPPQPKETEPSMKPSQSKETEPSTKPSQSKETEPPTKPLQITLSPKEGVTTQSSAETNVEKKDLSPSKMDKAMFMFLRPPFGKTRSSQTEKETPSDQSHESRKMASTPPLINPSPSAPSLVTSPSSKSAGSRTSKKSLGSSATSQTDKSAAIATAAVTGGARASSQAANSPSKDRALRKALKKAGALSSARTLSKNDDTASNLHPGAAVDPSSTALSPTASTVTVASKINDTASSLPPVAAVAASSSALSMTVSTAATAASKSINNKSERKGDGMTTSDSAKAGTLEKEKRIDTKAVTKTKVKSKAKKEVGHANSTSQVTHKTKEAHRNMRFWKKRSDMKKRGVLRPEDAGEEFVEDKEEAIQRDKLITKPVVKSAAEIELKSESHEFFGDNRMPEETLVKGLAKYSTFPIAEGSSFKSLDRNEPASASILRQMHCGCLADCIPNVKDGKWEDKRFGVTNKALASDKRDLDGEMDIDQAVAAMRRSKRMEPLPIKSIAIPKHFITTSTSSVTDSQAGVPPHKHSISGNRSRSYESGTSQNRHVKIFPFKKLGRKSLRRRTERY